MAESTISLVELVNIYEAKRSLWRIKVNPQTQSFGQQGASIKGKRRLDVPVFSFILCLLDSEYVPALVGAVVKVADGTQHFHIAVVLPLTVHIVVVRTEIPLRRYMLAFPPVGALDWIGVKVDHRIQPCACFPRFSTGQSMIDLLVSSHEGQEFYVQDRTDISYGCGHLQAFKMQKWPSTWLSCKRLKKYLKEFQLCILKDDSEETVDARSSLMEDFVEEDLSVDDSESLHISSDDDLDGSSDGESVLLFEEDIVKLDDEGCVDYLDHDDDYNEDEDILDPDYIDEDS